ncbi:hypothetical protein J2W32_000350 [Variovorax boronicumulans]|uniref:Uncharacterized protein n=1 Tax=Variovorax boronicumulans TaxID=436515 RepID=A0AAW8CIY0_9BURK|nr:hypothetical protein [Variovorax boronicumulans]MDP9891253.1 hypothetical protein [Variovorax boronicumulans]MDQ0051321.1 hypothetical protein [Variovorax boronicumulans]
MKAFAIAACIVGLVLLYGVVDAIDEATRADWDTRVIQRAPGCTP